MIASINRPKSKTQTPAWHGQFLEMLPRIINRAQMAFRDLDSEARQDAVAEVAARAFIMFARLVELGKANLAFASVLARYGIAQYRAGRRVGGRRRVKDVLSQSALRLRRFQVDRLDHFDRDACVWEEVLVEDRRAGPAEIAASRIDFANWLRSLPRRDRRIAKSLALSHTTGEVAKRFGVSAARVSQIRSELRDSWLEFQGEARSEEALTAA